MQTMTKSTPIGSLARLVISAALALCALLVLSAFAPSAHAVAGTDFTVTGGDYIYEDGLLVIEAGGTYTVAMASGTNTTTDTIVIRAVGEVVNLTLNGVNISATNASPIMIMGNTGSVNITLVGENTLDASAASNYAGISVPDESNLSITAESTGSLNVSGGDYAAGIGGSYDGSTGVAAGNITINGGTINATGGIEGAGIGSAYYNASVGDITINGGTITATCGPATDDNRGNTGAAIGSGCSSTAGTITITGGTINATGSDVAAGIGASFIGECTAVIITGGTINATSIGIGDISECASVSITGGLVMAESIEADTSFTLNAADHAVVVLDSAPSSTCVFSKGVVFIKSSNALTVYGSQTVSGIIATIGSNAAGPLTASGSTLTLSSCTISGDTSALVVDSDKTLTVESGKTVALTSSVVAVNSGGSIAVSSGAIFAVGNGNTGVTLDTSNGSLNNAGAINVNASSSLIAAAPCGTVNLSSGATYVVAGGFTLTAEEALTHGTDYTYASNTFTILSDAATTLACTGSTTAHTIAVGSATQDATGYGITANLTLNGMNISSSASPITVASGSTLNLTLAENSENTLKAGGYGSAGITVPGGAILTISGTGSLDVKGGQEAAGIGQGNSAPVGEIIITGGTITATGGDSGAGIGGAYDGAGGTVTISGGVVYAYGGDGAAGIGAGSGGASQGSFSTGTATSTATRASTTLSTTPSIVYLGGGVSELTFTSGSFATLGTSASGVATMQLANSDGTGNAFIVASSIGDNDDTSSWSGTIITLDGGAVYGDSYTLGSNATIPAGYTLTLTADNSSTSAQTLTVASGATLTVNGTITVVDPADGTEASYTNRELTVTTLTAGKVADSTTDTDTDTDSSSGSSSTTTTTTTDTTTDTPTSPATGEGGMVAFILAWFAQLFV